MKRQFAQKNSIGSRWRASCCQAADISGAQIVELAVSLPLLVVIFVGIYDFSQAFVLKHKLSDAAREGARFASNQSTSDLTTNPPASILATRDVIDNYLIANQVNDCGLNSALPKPLGNWQWQFSAAGCSIPGLDLVLTIDRGYLLTYVPSGGSTYTVEATQVRLDYPYQWQFNQVVKLIAPGANYGNTQIPTTAVMQNLN